MLAHIIKAAGNVVGMTSKDGADIDGHLSVKDDVTGPTLARIVLHDPAVCGYGRYGNSPCRYC